MILQAERGEFVLLPNGELVQVAANKRHNKVDKDLITDDLPDQSYIFSDAKHMRLKKKDFEDLVINTQTPDYVEGEKPKQYKETNFAKEYITKQTETPASVIKTIQRKHKVLKQKELKDNPFIQAANKENIEGRAAAVNIVKEFSEDIKPADSDNDTTDQPLENNISPLQQNNGMNQQNNLAQPSFQSGGTTNNIQVVPMYQNGGEIASGALSGAGTGAAIGTLFGPGPGTLIGAGVGALVGGVGAGIKAKKADKQKKKRLAELAKLNADRIKIAERFRGVSHLSTLGKLAVPDPKYSYLNLDDPIQRTKNTSANILTGYESRRNNLTGNALASSNTINRNIESLGLNPTQAANFAASNNANAINNATQAGANIDSQSDNLKLSTSNQLNNFDSILAQDKQRGKNITEAHRYNKYTNGINELASNEQQYLTNKDQLGVDNYEMKRAVDISESQYKAQSLGAFNNNIQRAGLVASQVQPYLNSTDLLKSDVNTGVGVGAIAGAGAGIITRDKTNNSNNTSNSNSTYFTFEGKLYKRTSDGSFVSAEYFTKLIV